MILQQRFTDCSGQPITNTKVTFTPVYSPEITSSFLAVSDPKTLTTNTNGEITGTLVDPYFYRVHIAKPLPETNFYDFVGTASVTVISASINSGIIPSIYGSLIDVIENPFTVKRVTITPARNYPVIYNSSIVVLASTSSLTDATGFIDFHLVPGAYRVDCFGSTDTSFFISVPTGSTPSWNIKDLIIVKPAKGISVKLTDADKSQVLTVSSSDARYLNFVSNTSISSSYSDFALQAGQAYIADQSQFADRATSASYAKSASWAPADIDVVITNVASASYADFAIQAAQAFIADQSQFADRATSASYAKSASYSQYSVSSSYVPDIDVVITSVPSASWSSASLSSSYALKSSTADTANSVPIFLQTNSNPLLLMGHINADGTIYQLNSNIKADSNGALSASAFYGTASVSLTAITASYVNDIDLIPDNIPTASYFSASVSSSVAQGTWFMFGNNADSSLTIRFVSTVVDITPPTSDLVNWSVWSDLTMFFATIDPNCANAAPSGVDTVFVEVSPTIDGFTGNESFDVGDSGGSYYYDITYYGTVYYYKLRWFGGGNFYGDWSTAYTFTSGFPDNFTIVSPTGGQGIPIETAANGSASAWTSLGSIQLVEGNTFDNFAIQTNKTLILTPYPIGDFHFKANTGSVSLLAGGDLSAASITVNSLSASILFTCGGTTHQDAMLISGLLVQPVDSGSTDNLAGIPYIYYLCSNSGSSVINGLFCDSSTFGNLSTVI